MTPNQHDLIIVGDGVGAARPSTVPHSLAVIEQGPIVDPDA